jgi:tartrate dehydrogenase/decarboxylase/D-malate dehydrogenase
MLDFFGYEKWGTRIVNAIEMLLSKGEELTPDLGGTASTSDCGDALVRLLTE